MVAVVSEIIHQADLGNHDQEVNHARMRHRLDVAQGSTFGFANAAFAHLGQEVGIRHSAFKRKGEKKRRGRRQVQKRRTKCFQERICGDSACTYYQEVEGEGDQIWSALARIGATLEMHEPAGAANFDDIARGRQAQIQSEESE